MPAMVMPFRFARPGDARDVHPGDRVRFEVRSSVVSKIHVIRTKQEFPIAAPARVLNIGDVLPDFELTDQLGRTFHSTDLRGRVAAVDFVYTRCPLPDVCPRLSASFAYAAKALQGKPVAFVSITVDPQYDTPGVLNAYAQRYRADSEQWRFLTGGMEQVKEVAGLFGLVFWPEENMIAHTVTTAVIDRDGRLAALVQGSSFRPAELRDLLQSVLNRH
jgi:protein SCO1/2